MIWKCCGKGFEFVKSIIWKLKERFSKPCHKDISISNRQALRVFKSFRHKAIHSKIETVDFFRRMMPISKRPNLRKLRLKLFEIPHQHFQFIHSLFIPFPFENLSEMKSECLQACKVNSTLNYDKKMITTTPPSLHQSLNYPILLNKLAWWQYFDVPLIH